MAPKSVYPHSRKHRDMDESWSEDLGKMATHSRIASQGKSHGQREEPSRLLRMGYHANSWTQPIIAQRNWLHGFLASTGLMQTEGLKGTLKTALHVVWLCQLCKARVCLSRRRPSIRTSYKVFHQHRLKGSAPRKVPLLSFPRKTGTETTYHLKKIQLPCLSNCIYANSNS